MLTLAIFIVQTGNLKDNELTCQVHIRVVSLKNHTHSHSLPNSCTGHLKSHVFQKVIHCFSPCYIPSDPTQHLNSRMFYIPYSYTAESITHPQTWDVDSWGKVYFRLSLSSHLSWGNIISLSLVFYHDNIFLLKFLWKYRKKCEKSL